MPRIVDYVGNRYGSMTVVKCLGFSPCGARPRERLMVRCDCGVEKEIWAANVYECGVCSHQGQRRPSREFGSTAQPIEYATWQSMKQRCLNPKLRSWGRYGGRGISVAPEWLTDFSAFFRHIGPRPSPMHSIDRINNDGNYEPGNVRWVNPMQQAENRRRTGTMTTKNAVSARRSHNGRTTAMLLDEGRKKREARGKMISFRLAKSHDDELRQLAKAMGGITPCLEAAVGLLGRVKAGLQGDKLRFQHFMTGHGLDPTTQEAEGIVLAVRAALDAAEKGRK